MEPNCNNVTERILRLTLEIVYLLTGEDDIVAKKALGDGQNSIMVPLRSLLIPGRNNEQKILEVTKKITDFLTGEVPIRCQDVSVYFSMEEWEYLEGHRDLYKDVVMENEPPLTSPDGSRKRNPPERCPRPLYSRDSTQEHHEILQTRPLYSQDSTQEHHEIPQTRPPYSQDSTQERHEIPHRDKGVQVFNIKTEIKAEEETHVRSKQPSVKEAKKMVTMTKGRSSLRISTRGHNGWNTSEGHPILSADYNKEDKGMAQNSPGTNLAAQNLHRKLNHMGREKLRTHKPTVRQKISTTEKPFACPECGKSFINRSRLVQHQKIHSGKKPFSCAVCGKSFIDKSQLNRHHIVHTGEKPFSCSECGKRFPSKGNRDKHMRIHTGEKPHSCPECGQGFAQKVTLILHKRKHATEGL